MSATDSFADVAAGMQHPEFRPELATPSEVELLLQSRRSARTAAFRAVSLHSKRFLVAGLLLCGVIGAFIAKRAFTACSSRASLGGDLLLLREVGDSEMEGLINLADDDKDRSVLGEWLSTASSAGDAADAVGLADAKSIGEVQAAVERAVRETNRTESDQILERAMHQSMGKWQEKRKNLKAFINKRKLEKPINAKVLGRTPAQKATVAECVFNVLQASDQLAALAVNINDADKTCGGATVTSDKVCAVNVAGIFFATSVVAGSLSLAADNCAATLIPNVDAQCAGAVTGLIASVSQMAGSGALTSASCLPPGTYDYARTGAAPSDWGSKFVTPKLVHRRLSSADDAAVQNATAETGAPGRRLVFGGGIRADGAQCLISATSVAWWLAQAGLAINAAANKHAGASCPPRHKIPLEWGKEDYRTSQAFCTVDVAGAIFAFGQAIQFLQLAGVQCSDELNLRALCGAGIDGILTSFAGVANAGAALHLACEKFQKPGGKFRAPRKDFRNPLGLEGNFGRRLQDADAELEELKQRFGSPEEAWKSIGYDFSDPNAEFRKVKQTHLPAEDLVSLVSTPQPQTPVSDGAEKSASGSWLDAANYCH